MNESDFDYFANGGDFELNLQQKIYFAPHGEDETNQATAASVIPHCVWAEAEGVDIVWSTKWSINGLTCVRPMVMMTSAISLPPGRTFQVTSGASAAPA